MANRYLYLARHGDAVDDGALSYDGRQQARLLGERLSSVPLAGIYHSPLTRAVETAELVAESVPGVPLHSSPALGDYFPPVSDPQSLPDAYARFLDGVAPEEFREGAELAAAAIAQHSAPVDVDTRELVVTHNFAIAWFVRHALDAPDWRWLGLNQSNCAITAILYRPDRPPALLCFNDMGHLPVALRWTGFPPELRV